MMNQHLTIQSTRMRMHALLCDLADPLTMLQSGNIMQIKTAVTAIAANAQVLGLLTVTRALSECQGVQLLNELFAKVSCCQYEGTLHVVGIGCD